MAASIVGKIHNPPTRVMKIFSAMMAAFITL
jgi:hypothetical protein